jgi:hypothetical protein
VIAVLVCDYDAVEVRAIHTDLSEPAKDLASAEPGVDEDVCRLGGDEDGIAGRTAA